jgi:hypothetical protein
MWMFSRKKEKNQVSRPTADAGFSTPPVAATVTASSAIDEEHPYYKYGLASPPKGDQSVSPEHALGRIKKDSRTLHRIVENAQKEGASDETKAEAKKIMFLYCRGFMIRDKKRDRKEKVKEMIKKENKNSERLLQVLEANGDNDLSPQSEYWDQYNDLCLTLDRYFDLPNTFSISSRHVECEVLFSAPKERDLLSPSPVCHGGIPGPQEWQWRLLPSPRGCLEIRSGFIPRPSPL